MFIFKNLIKKFVLIKIKYHGKINKIIKQLEKQQIILEKLVINGALKLFNESINI